MPIVSDRQSSKMVLWCTNPLCLRPYGLSLCRFACSGPACSSREPSGLCVTFPTWSYCCRPGQVHRVACADVNIRLFVGQERTDSRSESGQRNCPKGENRPKAIRVNRTTDTGIFSKQISLSSVIEGNRRKRNTPDVWHGNLP